MAVPRHVVIALIIPIFLALALLPAKPFPPEDSLYRELSESMMSGKSIPPDIGRDLPPEAGQYLGFFCRRPPFSRGYFSGFTVRMRGAAAFSGGCVGVETTRKILDGNSLVMSEFKVRGFAPNVRCH